MENLERTPLLFSLLNSGQALDHFLCIVNYTHSLTHLVTHPHHITVYSRCRIGGKAENLFPYENHEPKR